MATSGVGSEVLCLLSGGMDTSGREVSDPKLVIGERVLRRWFIERTSLRHDQSVGLGLHLLQGADLTPTGLRRVAMDAQNEARKVDGVLRAVVTAALEGGLCVVTAVITIFTGQTFRLTAGSDMAVELLDL